jgi:hypothetical protein
MAYDLSGGQEVKSNWFKFNVEGDAIKGTLINKRLAKSTQPNFPDQWVYEIKTEDGNVFNVGISTKKSGTCQRLNNCKMGEIIGILLESVTKSKTKGFADTKNLKVLTFGMDATYGLGEDVTGEVEFE